MSGLFQNSNLVGEIVAEENLEATICMPKEKEVLKLASAPTISEVTLPASAWVSSEEKRHSQVVEIVGSTNKSQIDLTPDDEQLIVFYEKDVTFVTKNESGTVTVIAIGQKPLNDYTVQVTMTEVNVPDGTTIWGVTVGTPMNPESFGTPLPEVSDEDNGKVLKAQGGQWVAKEDETAESLSNIEIENLLKNFT